MRCKEIQDNAVRAFTKHYSRWSGLKKRLDEFNKLYEKMLSIFD